MSKILAIDANKANLKCISVLLMEIIPGCNAITAKTGQKGIEKAINDLPDVILLNIQMPGMNGYEVCRH